MKESTLATKLMIAVLCVGVLLYLGLSFLASFQEEIVTTTAYEYAVDVGKSSRAIIVREETLLSGSGSYVDLTLSEGEKAAAGSTVALVYSDPSTLDTLHQIRTLEAELEQMRHALQSGTQSVDSSKLDQQVVNSIVSLRCLTANGDLSQLESSVLNLRTMVFQRDYAYGNTLAAQQMADLISDKETTLASLQRSLDRTAYTITAPASGVFSGEVDGYEDLITPDMLGDLTVDELDKLLDRSVPDRTNAAGKIITDSTWYLCALFDGANDMNFTLGRTYNVTFSHDFYGTVGMKLERIETGAAGTMLILSARTHLADTTLLRVQTVDITVDRLEGIRIPRKALRVETREVENEDGTTSKVNVYGVYTVVGSQAEWQSVKVLHTGETFYLVKPADEEAAGRLRAGDSVILSSSGLYNGKVIRQS